MNTIRFWLLPVPSFIQNGPTGQSWAMPGMQLMKLFASDSCTGQIPMHATRNGPMLLRHWIISGKLQRKIHNTKNPVPVVKKGRDFLMSPSLRYPESDDITLSILNDSYETDGFNLIFGHHDFAFEFLHAGKDPVEILNRLQNL